MFSLVCLMSSTTDGVHVCWNVEKKKMWSPQTKSCIASLHQKNWQSKMRLKIKSSARGFIQAALMKVFDGIKSLEDHWWGYKFKVFPEGGTWGKATNLLKNKMGFIPFFGWTADDCLWWKSDADHFTFKRAISPDKKCLTGLLQSGLIIQ